MQRILAALLLLSSLVVTSVSTLTTSALCSAATNPIPFVWNRRTDCRCGRMFQQRPIRCQHQDADLEYDQEYDPLLQLVSFMQLATLPGRSDHSVCRRNLTLNVGQINGPPYNHYSIDLDGGINSIATKSYSGDYPFQTDVQRMYLISDP